MQIDRLQQLTQKVRNLYEDSELTGADWADWLYHNHVFVVAGYAKQLAADKGADVELAEAAGILHDIADAIMDREDPRHEDESLAIARRLLTSCGFNDDEIAIVVDDALRLHSCHDGKRPSSLEGQVLATADALAHFNTDFYLFATAADGADGTPLADTKAWALKKLDRDFTGKICFDDVRETARPQYTALRDLFSR